MIEANASAVEICLRRIVAWEQGIISPSSRSMFTTPGLISPFLTEEDVQTAKTKQIRSVMFQCELTTNPYRRRGKKAVGHRCGMSADFIARNGTLASWLPQHVERMRVAAAADVTGNSGPALEFTAELAQSLCDLRCPFCLDMEAHVQQDGARNAAKAARAAARAAQAAHMGPGAPAADEQGDDGEDGEEEALVAEMEADEAVIPAPNSEDEDSDFEPEYDPMLDIALDEAMADN